MNGIQNNLTPVFSKLSKTKGRRDPSLEKFKIVYLILSRDEQGISTPTMGNNQATLIESGGGIF